jgi:hypothetical protein
MLTRMQIDGIRVNTERFLEQECGSTIALMPMAPKRLLAMCDTIDELFAKLEEEKSK